MQMDIFRLLLAIGLAVLVVSMARVAFELLTRGEAKVRDVRAEGGGIVEKLRGELVGGQREPSSMRAHGVRFRVTRDGKLDLREKSVIARNP